MSRPGPRKLSYQRLRCLQALADNRPVYSHCRTRSDWGGLQGTVTSLERRGLTRGGELTEAGRAALAGSLPAAQGSKR